MALSTVTLARRRTILEWEGYRHRDWEFRFTASRTAGRALKCSMDLMRVIDLQDIGTRYYTFIWTLYLLLKACSTKGIQVVVLDRPNPINGVTVEGPIAGSCYPSFRL